MCIRNLLGVYPIRLTIGLYHTNTLRSGRWNRGYALPHDLAALRHRAVFRRISLCFGGSQREQQSQESCADPKERGGRLEGKGARLRQGGEDRSLGGLGDM